MQNILAIVLNYHKTEQTLDCLSSLMKGSIQPNWILLIDNESSDTSFEQFLIELGKLHGTITAIGEPIGLQDKKVLQQIIVIQSKRNLGYTGGNNLGLRFALNYLDFSFVWLLNNDCQAEKRALESLLEIALSDAQIGVVGSKLLFANVPNMLQAAGGARFNPATGLSKLIGIGEIDLGQWDREVILDYVTGASMFVRRDAIEKACLFLEKYFLYWEDADISRQIMQQGYRLSYAWKSRIWHHHDPAAVPSPIADYYISKNISLFLRRNYPRYVLSGTLYSCLGRIGKRIWHGYYRNAILTAKGLAQGFLRR